MQKLVKKTEGILGVNFNILMNMEMTPFEEKLLFSLFRLRYLEGSLKNVMIFIKVVQHGNRQCFLFILFILVW
jgi:hypothetical protein